MMTSDAITMIAFQATPSGRRRFRRVAASFVGADALHRRFSHSLPRTKISAVLATASNVSTL